MGEDQALSLMNEMLRNCMLVTGPVLAAAGESDQRFGSGFAVRAHGL